MEVPKTLAPASDFEFVGTFKLLQCGIDPGLSLKPLRLSTLLRLVNIGLELAPVKLFLGWGILLVGFGLIAVEGLDEVTGLFYNFYYIAFILYVLVSVIVPNYVLPSFFSAVAVGWGFISDIVLDILEVSIGFFTFMLFLSVIVDVLGLVAPD